MSSDRRDMDSRLAAARYRVERELPAGDDESDEKNEAGQSTLDQRAQFVEMSIQQAMRRGDFDDLPGKGRPIPGLDRVHDPNWWIKQKIEREGLTGLAPPALGLRKENAELDARLDEQVSEIAVRDLLTDFNSRIIEARRQLLGGPPVVTPIRDVEAEVIRWRERRDARRRATDQEREREASALAAMSWRERRRARRRA
jgi:hypothetical protein